MFENMFEKEQIAISLEKTAELFNCDLKTAWDKYTHDAIKECASYEEIEKIIGEERHTCC